MKDSTFLSAVAIVSGVAYGWICFEHGLNSALAFVIAAGIFGVAGYEIKTWRVSK